MIEFDETALKILSPEQQSLKPLLEEFMSTHFLVGGTAIALQIGHRKSIDFDLFTLSPQGSGKQLSERIERAGCVLEEGSDIRYLSDEEEPEATLKIHGVKVQLMNFNRNPFGVNIKIPHSVVICGGIYTPTLLDLAALKAYAMMYRKKWKDAVDLYFLLQEEGIDFARVLDRTKELFGILYQEIATLDTILDDTWDMTEAVEYIVENPPSDEKIREELIVEAREYLGRGKNDSY